MSEKSPGPVAAEVTRRISWQVRATVRLVTSAATIFQTRSNIFLTSLLSQCSQEILIRQPDTGFQLHFRLPPQREEQRRYWILEFRTRCKWPWSIPPGFELLK